jgi:hypothetical protein
VGYFKVEISATGTALGVNLYGGDSYDHSRAKVLREVPALLEAEVLTGVWNATNSLGTATATRTMQGIRRPAHVGQLHRRGRVVLGESPSLHRGCDAERVQQRRGDHGDVGHRAGPQYFRDISNMNDTKVQDSNAREVFKRVIRNYEGPFGQCTVFLSRALLNRELLVVIPRERIRVLPLQSRNFVYQEMGKSGDNIKGIVVGDYTAEVYHPSAMGRLRTSSPA